MRYSKSRRESSPADIFSGVDQSLAQRILAARVRLRQRDASSDDDKSFSEDYRSMVNALRDLEARIGKIAARKLIDTLERSKQRKAELERAGGVEN